MKRVKTPALLLSLATLVAALLAILLIVGKESIGMFLWSSVKMAPLATLVSPRDAELRFALGNYYFGNGAYDIEKAQSYFRKAVELDPQIGGAHYQLGRTYFIQSGFFDALKEINKEIELHPDFKRSHYMRGLIYGYTNRFADAENDFKEFLKWKPDSWAAHNDLAWVYFQEGKYAEVVRTARAGLKIAPENPWLLNSLGVALLNTGDKTGAKEAFIKSLSILNSMSPKDWGAAYPGNNPQIYGEGFEKMKRFVEDNLRILGTVDSGKTDSKQ